MIEVRWLDKGQQIINYRFLRGWNWDDLYAAEKQSREMAASVSHAVYIVLDLRDAQLIPKNALSHINITMNRQPDNLEGILLIGANAFVKILMNTLERLRPRGDTPMIYVETEEALQTWIEKFKSAGAASH
ncbi:MAG: hypothetical protein KC546_13820 [Anaerolineae bacterium]|nr:hypothetical protein [Anaerolineae bacterium]